MNIAPVPTRIIHIRGEDTLTRAYNKAGECSERELATSHVSLPQPVVYLARVELGERNCPDLLEGYEMNVVDTWIDVYYQRRQRPNGPGPSGEPLTFKRLIEHARQPTKRAEKKLEGKIGELIHTLFPEHTLNMNLQVYSGYGGVWGQFHNHFDPELTYRWVPEKILREIKNSH